MKRIAAKGLLATQEEFIEMVRAKSRNTKDFWDRSYRFLTTELDGKWNKASLSEKQQAKLEMIQRFL